MSGFSRARLPGGTTFHRLPLALLALLALLAAALPPRPAAAAAPTAPTLEHLFPAGAAPGSTNPVTLTAKAEPWPPQVWIDRPGLTFVAETNQNRFRVEVAPDALPGPRLVRLFNAEGASEPRFFIVGAGPETAEAEPNSSFAAPQVLPSLPVTVNGRLDKTGDVDSFAVTLEAGQWLDARLDAYTLMSKLDGVLRLVDPEGRVLSWNHDDATLDPRITWQASSSRTVIVQVFGFRHPADASIQLAGGESAVYRLHLASTASPPGDPPAPDLPNLPEPAPPADAPASPSPAAIPQAPLSLPVAIHGRISQPREIDRFLFLAPTGSVVTAEIEAARLGSPLDAWLRIEDAAGKELAHNDDLEGSRDPRLEWVPAAASPGVPFVVAVGSLTHRGGPAYRYRLTLRTAGPTVEAGLDAGALSVAPGSTNELKFRVKRLRGHARELIATVEGLPDGVQAAPVTVKPADTEPVVRLVAATNAAPFNGPFRLLLADPAAPPPRAVPFELVSRGENNGVPQGYSRLAIDRTDFLWLTVRPVPVPAATNTPAAP